MDYRPVKPLSTLAKLDLGISGYYLSRRHHGYNGVQTYDLYRVDQRYDAGWNNMLDPITQHKKIRSFPDNVTLEEIKAWLVMERLNHRL